MSYHDETDSVSNSMLADFCESRRLYEGRYVTGEIPRMEASKTMDIGTIVHTALLDGRPLRSSAAIFNPRNELTAAVKDITKASREAMLPEVVVAICQEAKMNILEWGSEKTLKGLKEKFLPLLPKQHVDSRGAITPAGKEFAEQKKREGYTMCLKRSEFEHVEKLINVVRCSDAWLWMEKALQDGTTEQATRWTNDIGMDCRCKPDFYLELSDRILAFDLKITAFHTPKFWRSQIENNSRNKTQGPHYCDGLRSKFDKPVDWHWVCINPAEPITEASICLNQLDAESWDSCEQFYKRKMMDMKQCQETGDFSEDHESEIQTITLRKFAFN